MQKSLLFIFLDLSEVKKRLMFEAMRKKESRGRTEESADWTCFGAKCFVFAEDAEVDKHGGDRLVV